MEMEAERKRKIVLYINKYNELTFMVKYFISS